MLFVETSLFTAQLARYERSDIDRETLRRIAGKLELLE